MIYVPFTFIHPPTWEALSGEVVMPVKMDDDDAYLGLMRALWWSEEESTIVEHDVVVQPDQLEQLHKCPSEWCCFPELGGSPSLSLVRFRPGFCAANRGLWTTDWVLPAGQRPSWTWLDSHLVAKADRKPCLHLDPPCVNERPRGPLH